VVSFPGKLPSHIKFVEVTYYYSLKTFLKITNYRLNSLVRHLPL